LTGVWAAGQGRSTAVAGRERTPYLQLLIDRAPFYALAFTLLMLMLLS